LDRGVCCWTGVFVVGPGCLLLDRGVCCWTPETTTGMTHLKIDYLTFIQNVPE
jgi:hypothetical protein